MNLRYRAPPRRALAALLVAALGAPGCARSEREQLTLATVPLPALGLVFVAQAEGYFEARGLSVEQRRFTTGRDAMGALARGEVDAAVAFVTPVVLRASADPELEVVTTLHASNRNTRLVARADRGVARDRDLAGRRIGVPRGTNAEYFLHALLEYAGVPDSAVEIVDVAPDAAPAALAAGTVDAIASWPPHADRARHLLGEGGAVELFTDVYTETSMLVTRDSVHGRRRGALVKLVAALSDAERLVRERPDEALAALATAFPDIPEASLRDAWGRVRPALGLSHLLAYALESEWAWFRGEGRIGGAIDVGRLIDPDVLTQVDPEAVTFVSPARGKGPR